MRTRTPWGWKIINGRHMRTANYADIRRWEEIGQAAVELLLQLGISQKWLESITDAEDPLKELERLKAGGVPGEYDEDHRQTEPTPSSG